MFITMYSTTWKFQAIDPGSKLPYIGTESLIYKGCNCEISSRCSQSSRTMISGCHPLEAPLQSTRQYFYDQQCIDANETF